MKEKPTTETQKAVVHFGISISNFPFASMKSFHFGCHLAFKPRLPKKKKKQWKYSVFWCNNWKDKKSIRRYCGEEVERTQTFKMQLKRGNTSFFADANGLRLWQAQRMKIGYILCTLHTIWWCACSMFIFKFSNAYESNSINFHFDHHSRRIERIGSRLSAFCSVFSSFTSPILLSSNFPVRHRIFLSFSLSLGFSHFLCP